jgi:hemerythrin-like domain-containing protein
MLAQRHALTTIHEEHRALASALKVLEQSATQLLMGVDTPLVERIGAALEYIEVFPDSYHHPKEEEYLFARLRRATAEANDVLQSLENEHREGYGLRADLKYLFERIRAGETALIAGFVADTKTYIAFQFSHMRVEEEIVVPLAIRTLTPDDWHVIASAFLGNRDPRFGWDARRDLGALLERARSGTVASSKRKPR